MDRTLLRVSQNIRAGRGNGLPRWHGGHDAQQRGTPRARQGVDLVDAPEQLRPAVARGPQGPVHRISDRDGLLDRGASGRLASPHPPGPASAPVGVARHHLTRESNSSGSRAAVPAVGPSALSER